MTLVHKRGRKTLNLINVDVDRAIYESWAPLGQPSWKVAAADEPLVWGTQRTIWAAEHSAQSVAERENRFSGLTTTLPRARLRRLENLGNLLTGLGGLCYVPTYHSAETVCSFLCRRASWQTFCCYSAQAWCSLFCFTLFCRAFPTKVGTYSSCFYSIMKYYYCVAKLEQLESRI